MDELNEAFLANNSVGSLGDIVTDADMWFDNLQDVLDAGGCRLDLNVPEQSIRLAVFHIEDIGDGEHRITPHYALDPQERPIDLLEITEEEALSRQSDELPEPAIQSLFQAAKEGRLFVRSSMGADHRQVLVGDNGLPRLGNPFTAPSAEDERYQVSPQEPQIPKRPGRDVQRQAEAGDRDAQFLIEDYEDAVQQHREWKESMALRAKNPDKARIADAMVHVTSEYYMNMSNDGITDYSLMVSNIQQRYELSLLSPEERAYRAYAQQTEMQVGALRDGIIALKNEEKLPMDQPLREEAVQLLAERLAFRDEQRRVEAWDVSRDGAIQPKTEAEMLSAAQAIREAPAFIEGAAKLTGKALDELLSVEPEKFGRELDKLRTKLENPALFQPQESAPEPEPQPVPGLSELAKRFQSLHDRLKQDDSRWNWRNSEQYDNLVTALDKAAKAFSGVSGYLDDTEKETLRQSVEEVSRRAEYYQKHIGEHGKNARQQRRLEATGEVLALTGELFDKKDPSRWQTFAETHNAQERKAYYDRVRDLTGNIPTEEEINGNRDLSPAEKFEQREMAQARHSLKRTEDNYDAAMQRTEELRARIEHGQAEESKQYLLKVDAEVLKAREELTRMVLHKAPDPKQMQKHFAAVIAGTETHLVNLPGGNVGERFFEARKQMYEASPALKSMVQGASVPEVTEFLTGPGEHLFTNRLKGRMASPLYASGRQQAAMQPEKAPEQKNPERGGMAK